MKFLQLSLPGPLLIFLKIVIYLFAPGLYLQHANSLVVAYGI